MPSPKHSCSNLILGSLALTLCLLSTTLAQDAQSVVPQPPKIIRKSGGVFQGSATKRVEPAYPPLAKAAQISGSVVVEVTVDEEGNVVSARPISGHPLLKDSAVSAAKGWKFSPTMLQSVPVKVIGTITFNFITDEPWIELATQRLAADPNSPELHFELGRAYSRHGQDEKAIEAYNQALQLKPDYADAHFWMGRAYETLSRYDKAIEAFKQALSLKPERAEEVYLTMARTYLKLDRPDEALDAAKQASSIKGDFSEAHAVVGFVLTNERRYSEAVEYLKQAIEVNADVALHSYLGIAYVGLGDLESAMNEYRILKEKDPGKAERLLNRINKEQ